MVGDLVDGIVKTMLQFDIQTHAELLDVERGRTPVNANLDPTASASSLVKLAPPLMTAPFRLGAY